jgi:hypothetical protein
MHRRLIVALAAAAVSCAGAITLAAPAQADTPRCVSHREHDRLHVGMPKWRVHEITDTRGVFWDGHAGGYTRRYAVCWRTQKHLYITYNALEQPHTLDEMGMYS